MASARIVPSYMKLNPVYFYRGNMFFSYYLGMAILDIFDF